MSALTVVLLVAIVVAVLVVAATGSLLSLVALPGAVLVLWLPGFLLSMALLPRTLTVFERLAVSILGSVALVILIGIGLDLAGVRLTTVSWAIALALVTAVLVGVGIVRGGVSLPSLGPAVRRRVVAPGRGDLLLIGLALVLVVGAIGIARFGVAIQPRQAFTELWMRPAGTTIRIGVRSEEDAATTFRVVLSGPDFATVTWNDVRLEPSSQWERDVEIAGRLRKGGTLALFRADASSTPYRQLSLPPAANLPAAP